MLGGGCVIRPTVLFLYLFLSPSHVCIRLFNLSVDCRKILRARSSLVVAMAGGNNVPKFEILSFCEIRQPSATLVKEGDWGLRGDTVDAVTDKRMIEIGKRLFFLPHGDSATSGEQVRQVLNSRPFKNTKAFFEVFLRHLDRHRVLLLEGAAGSGKSTLVEEIAMLYIAEEDKAVRTVSPQSSPGENETTIVSAHWIPMSTSEGSEPQMTLRVGFRGLNPGHQYHVSVSQKRGSTDVPTKPQPLPRNAANIPVCALDSITRMPGYQTRIKLKDGEGNSLAKHTVKNRGYCIITNGSNTLTEQRLFSYNHGDQEWLGPLAKMARDAKANPTSRYVFILHEYNRVPDFLSIFGNFFESELRHSGPDAWKREREPQSIHQSSTAVAKEILNLNHSEDSGSFLHLPENVKLILTGNPAQNEEFMGETTDFLRDPALSNNRLVGAKVDLGDFSLEKEEKFPCNVIEVNLLDYVERTFGTDAKQRVEEHWEMLDNETGVNAGKKVALAWQLLLERNENPNEGGSGDPNKCRWDFARKYQELIKELVKRCMAMEGTDKPEQRPRKGDFLGETCELTRLKLFRRVKTPKFPVRIRVWGTSNDPGLRFLLSGETGMLIKFPLERQTRPWNLAENYFGDVWHDLRRFLIMPVAPGPGAVAPSGPGAVAPSGSGAVAPSGSGAVAPSGSGAVAGPSGEQGSKKRKM